MVPTGTGRRKIIFEALGPKHKLSGHPLLVTKTPSPEDHQHLERSFLSVAVGRATPSRRVPCQATCTSLSRSRQARRTNSHPLLRHS